MPDPEKGPARCGECGLLTLKGQNNALIEVDAEYRETGKTDVARDKKAICLVRAEVVCGDHEPGAQAEPFILQRLRLPRNCGKFLPWTQGFSPKEHLEMDMLERAKSVEVERLREQREWQQEQRRQDQERDERLRKEGEERQAKRRQEDQSRADRQRREDIRQRWYLAVLPFALATAWYFAKDHVEKPTSTVPAAGQSRPGEPDNGR